MHIISQDLETGIFFENMDGWDIIDNVQYEIVFYKNGIKWIMGKYKTKHKAHAVIARILEAYRDCQIVRFGGYNIHSTNYWKFMMPLDNEVTE
jgi:hypothetical protein